MGTEAEDILASFGLTDKDSKKYDMVKARFELTSRGIGEPSEAVGFVQSQQGQAI